MKLPLRTLPFFAICALSTVALAAVPAIDVTVSNAAGKVAYKGKITGSGAFSTGQLEPGNYTVQFNSSAVKSGAYTIVVSAGKKKVSSNAVSADQFGKGGVAMKVDVPAGTNITGQVATGGTTAAASASNAKTKVVNGKTYVWMGPETGSNMGGQWVEEGDSRVSRQNISKGSAGSLQGMQDRSVPGAPSGK